MANQPEHISDQIASVYSRYRFVIGAMVLAGHLIVGLNVFAVSPVLPLAIDDYSINRATASLLAVSYTHLTLPTKA